MHTQVLIPKRRWERQGPLYLPRYEYPRHRRRSYPRAAVALVVSVTPVGVSSGTATTAGVDTTGATFIAIYACGTSGFTPTITDSKSNTWTALTLASNGSRKGQWFYCANPTVGASHTFSGSSTGTTFCTIFPSAWSGVATSSPFDQQNTNNNSTTNLAITTGSVTPGQDNELLLAGTTQANGNTDTYAVDSSFTLDKKLVTASFEGGCTAYQIQTTATARNPSFTVTSSGGSAASIATFKPIVAGTATQYLPMMGVGS